jgi:hypothetical protein
VQLTLVAPSTGLTPQPPLAGTLFLGEQEPQTPIFRHVVHSREHVAVGVDAQGRPVSVSVVQRLRVVGKGDYLYVVPAPVTSVAATGDSESEPGQRQGAIRWAGFSPSVRRLGARAQLDRARAARFLPLTLSIRATVDGQPLRAGTRRTGRLEFVLTLRNATQTRAPSASARGDVAALARALDGARRGVYPAGGVIVSVGTPVHARTALIEAPLDVRGEVSFPVGHIAGGVAAGGQFDGSRVRFKRLLGDGSPLGHVVRLSGRAVGLGAPRIRIVATPVEPRRTLAPPSGSSWAGSARLGHGLDPRALLDVAQNAFLRIARVSQYNRFLANPDKTGAGTSAANYVYVSAPPQAAPAPPPARGGGLGTLGLALAVVGGIAAAGALAVAWAHL